jgi:hypothetical protein
VSSGTSPSSSVNGNRFPLAGSKPILIELLYPQKIRQSTFPSRAVLIAPFCALDQNRKRSAPSSFA